MTSSSNPVSVGTFSEVIFNFLILSSFYLNEYSPRKMCPQLFGRQICFASGFLVALVALGLILELFVSLFL